MKRIAVVTGLLFLMAATPVLAQAACPTGAVNPVNPTVFCWNAPTTNADGSPLQDLAKYTIKVRAASAPTGTVLRTIDVPSPTAAPAAGTTVSRGSTASPIFREINLPDGAYFAFVSATDTTNNESAEQAAGVPFRLNVVRSEERRVG